MSAGSSEFAAALARFRECLDAWFFEANQDALAEAAFAARDPDSNGDPSTGETP